MNCSNCGKPLLAGSPICAVCGTDNSVQNAQVTTNNLQENVSAVPQIEQPQDVTVQEVPLQQLETPSSNVLEVSESIAPSQTEVQELQIPDPVTDGQVANNTVQENASVQEVTTDSTETTSDQVSNSGDTGFVELDDEDKPEITENMAPPSLAVEEENLTQGAGDLSNEASVSTYSEEAVNDQIQEEKEEQIRQDERVDIAIPSVGAVTEVFMPSDGSAPEVEANNETIGENTSATTQLESPTKSKKFKISLAMGSKNVPKTLMIVVAIIFLIVGILLGKVLFSKNYCSTGSNANRSVLSNKKIKYVSDGKNNVTNIGGFTYKIPEAYTYDKSNGGLLVYGESDLFRIYIKAVDGLYADLSGAKNSIRASMQENQINVSSVKELKANDLEFLIFETTVKLNNKMIAFSDASNDQVFYLEIITANNGFDYEVLDIAADIIKNATYEEISTNMEKVDITDVSDISVKSALEYKNLTKK